MVLDREIVHPFSNPKVSVIIPIYKVEKYLRECLDCVVNQTLRDIEIICVNDCSPDNSQKILDEYNEKDNRLVLLRHEANEGQSAARNTGLAAAKGEYIFFIDSDDFLAGDNALQCLYDVAKADNSDETIGGILKWNEATGEKYPDWHENYIKEEIHGQSLIDLPQLWANVIPVNKLIRRSLLENHSIRFNENIHKHEDNPFSVQVHILARKISIITKTTYIYRQAQSGSVMNTFEKTESLDRCNYCYDIFSFIEADQSRHKFRDMFYPMYSRQLMESAKILSRFSPSKEEKTKLLEQWAKIVYLMPADLPGIPPRQRKIFTYIRKGEFDRAWTGALDSGVRKAWQRAKSATHKLMAHLTKNNVSSAPS